MYKDLRIIHTFYCISHHCLRHHLRLPECRNHVPVPPILWTGYSLVLPLAQAHPLDARIASIKRTLAWEFFHRTREASPKNTTRPYTKKRPRNHPIPLSILPLVRCLLIRVDLLSWTCLCARRPCVREG